MQFQWSKKKYTLRDLIAQCKDTLPVVISVAEGYTGSDGDDTHDVAGGSVFFVYAIEDQSRIVALTEDERYLSMARSCPVNFHIIYKDRSLSEPYRLDDIVLHENNNLGDLRIQMAAPDDGGLGPMDAGSSDIQGTLRVLDLYDERYLLCHSFIEGSFCETGVVSIPSYLPLAVVFATGCKNGSRTDFKEFLNQVNATSLKSQQEYAKQPRNAEDKMTKHLSMGERLHVSEGRAQRFLLKAISSDGRRLENVLLVTMRFNQSVVMTYLL